MRKITAMTAVAMLLSLFLNSGIGGLQTALAAPEDAITLNDSFRAAIIDTVDADKNGTITIGEMEGLNTLTIVGNSVTDITGIGYAVNLTSLTVMGTKVSSLPAEIASLTKLTALEVSSSEITEAGLPAELWTMTGLTTLDLKLNNIDSLPAGLANLINLEKLDLYGNGLSSLPDVFGSLTKLQELYLHRNDLSSLPGSVCSLGSLKTLTLWENNLSSLPAGFGGLSQLAELDIARNALTALPASFANLTGLTKLVLNNNRLTGLPEGVFAGMTNLNRLEIEYNYLNPTTGSDDRQNLAVASGATAVFSRQHDYAVSLDWNGGAISSGTTPNARYYHGETVTLPAAVKADYVFGGWDADGNGTIDAQAAQVVAIAPNPVTASSVVFKAIYGYTVTFRTERFGTIGGGTEDIVTPVNAGDHVAAVPEVSQLAGYDFLGWYDGQTKVTEAEILAMDIAANKAFTARYEATGTIHFADPGFGTALISAGADPNEDGFVTADELAAVPSLDLSGGEFENIAGIGGAAALLSLKLGDHGMEVLPGELANLTSLQSLDVSGNPLSALPDLSGLGSLTALDISDCAFTLVPDGAGLPASLTTLRMGGNRLASLPPWLLASTTIETMDLSDNLFYWFPANRFDAMTALSSLDLRGNYLNPDELPVGLPVFCDASLQTTYAITLNFDGGTGNMLPKPGYWFGEDIPLPAATRGESIFVGWDVDGDGIADTAEAGSTTLMPDPPDAITAKTYTAIYISQNPRLSAIGLSAGAIITPSFDPESDGCTVTLYDYVGSVTITPQLASSKAKMRMKLEDGEWASVGSIDVDVASSAEEPKQVFVEVTAEDGTTTKTYELLVVRAVPVSLKLTAIGFSAGVTRSPAFSPSVTAYSVLMPASVGTVTISATKAAPQTMVTIDGVQANSRSFSLGLGLTKTVAIVVSSPYTTDRTKTYTLTLKRGTTVSGFTAIPKVGTTPTLSPGGSNRMTFSYKMGGPGTAKIEIYKSGRWYPILTRAETTAGTKSWAWDGKVSYKYLAAGTYKARITPIANGITGTAYTITIKIVRYPTVSWRSYASTFRANGATYTLCTFKVNYPTNAVVQVINSKGKVAASVISYTNMPPSKYYAVTWNGTATAGNTAGLTAGALVPKGTYTVRITVGPKYYYKTIKITR